jgi:hypothetical protein
MIRILCYITTFRALQYQCGTRLQYALIAYCDNSGVPGNFVRGGGVQQIQLRTEDIENGDLGAVAP